ncbi:transposase, partial [Lactobacillus sp. ZJLC29-4]
LTPANVDDRKPVEELLREAPAHQVLADGGYLSKPLQKQLKSQGIKLFLIILKIITTFSPNIPSKAIPNTPPSRAYREGGSDSS